MLKITKNKSIDLFKKINLRLSVFEIAMIGLILSLALTAKLFDKFIPHVHPIHIIVLLVGISILRFYSSVLLIATYKITKGLLFSFEGPTTVAIGLHILQIFSLLLFSFTRLFRDKGWKIHLSAMIGFIVLTMSVYLFLMIIADSEYTRVSDSSIQFWERVRLALIYPGDWMNVTITTALAIGIVPTIYLTLNPLVKMLEQNRH